VWREFFVVCEECKRKKKSFWTERRGERGVLVKKVKLVSYHVVHLDYYIGQN
jgi:hypothetical protein